MHAEFVALVGLRQTPDAYRVVEVLRVGRVDRADEHIGQVAPIGRYVLVVKPVGGAAGLLEQFVNVEVALQLEVRPVVERVSKGVRDGFSPFQEFFPVGS